MPQLMFAAHAMGTDWKRDHNAAAATPVHAGERRIMAQVEALETTVATLEGDGGRVDPHAAKRIVGPMADALIETLNYDRGHLDGGRVSEWVHTLVRTAGWDLDTDTYITKESTDA